MELAPVRWDSASKLPALSALSAPVTEDFDQHTRHATTPDIGADEFRSIGPYSYHKNITIDLTKIDDASCGATLTSFPMLYNSVDTDLRDHVTDPQGDDIIFTSVQDATCGGAGLAPCILDHEVESWNAATGHLVAWVRLPSVNTNMAGSNTVIQIVYGNTDITSSTQTQKPADVWDPMSYQGVWHMTESNAMDSTSQGHDGTGGGDVAVTSSGQIDRALTFDSNGDEVNLGTWNPAASSLTIHSWVNWNGDDGTHQIIVAKRTSWSTPCCGNFIGQKALTN